MCSVCKRVRQKCSIVTENVMWTVCTSGSMGMSLTGVFVIIGIFFAVVLSLAAWCAAYLSLAEVFALSWPSRLWCPIHGSSSVV